MRMREREEESNGEKRILGNLLDLRNFFHLPTATVAGAATFVRKSFVLAA